MIRDMTRGNVTRHLVSFSVPIILGNLFQLAYNAVDSIVVGRFAGTGALAAVGTANPVMNIIILGVSGLCIGASVLMSEYFGANLRPRCFWDCFFRRRCWRWACRWPGRCCAC